MQWCGCNSPDTDLPCGLVCTVQEAMAGGLTNYTTLTIHITDADDLGPTFSHNATYTLSIPEGVRIFGKHSE